MTDFKRYVFMRSLLVVICFIPVCVMGQDSVTVLAGAELTQVVPQAFYFLGRSAPTQMRNSAAARFGSNRYVIAAMVDTAGYAADVRQRYEGFLITDSPISISGSELATGAYGFGFTSDDKLLIMDLGGKELFSISTTSDKDLKRPRPLVMSKSADGLRLYGGRNYVTIAAR